MQKLNEMCTSLQTPKGRVLRFVKLRFFTRFYIFYFYYLFGFCVRPKSGDRLILYLKDINLPKPDKYATCQMIGVLSAKCLHLFCPSSQLYHAIIIISFFFQLFCSSSSYTKVSTMRCWNGWASRKCT